MKNVKKLLALALAVVMLATVFVTNVPVYADEISSPDIEGVYVNLYDQQSGSSLHATQQTVMYRILDDDGLPKSAPHNTTFLSTDAAKSIFKKLWDKNDSRNTLIKENVQGLYRTDSDGYLYATFNSSSSEKALYDTDRERFVISTPDNDGFFPFGSSNYYFSMDTSFYFKAGVNGKNGDGKPIRFEFSGDDLMYVYIDDVLVLNGSSKNKSTTYIDFSTGEIHAMGTAGDATSYKWSPIDYTLYDAYRWALMQKKGYTDGSITSYVDDTGHTPLGWVPYVIKDEFKDTDIELDVITNLNYPAYTYKATINTLKPEYEEELALELAEVFDNIGTEAEPVYVLKKNSLHPLKFFYAESGGSASNLNVKFNLDLVNGVLYDGNGGVTSDGEASYNDPTAYHEGDPVTVDSNKFTRDGYTFTGWNTLADGSGTSYAPDDTFSMPDDTVVLYAQWQKNAEETQPNPPYIIEYCIDLDAKGTTNVLYTERNIQSKIYTLTSAPIKECEHLYYTATYGIPEMENKIFAGWYSTRSGSRFRTASKALTKTIDLSTMPIEENYLGEKVIRFFAGFVDEGTPSQDSDDTNYYGESSKLDGYSLEGVQIRKANIKDPYADGTTDLNTHNIQYDGLRFLTIYANKMMRDLDAVSSSNVEYGYAVAAKSRVEGVSNFTLETPNVKNAPCTKSVADMNHRYWNDYRLSTVVIKYETANEQTAEKLGAEVLARPYIMYTDANGFSRVAYDSYKGASNLGGGCFTSMSNAASALDFITKQ